MSDYEDMQNGLKHFAKKVIDILCDCYCDLIEEHYYRDTRCVNQNSNPAAAAAGWLRVEWRGTEYTLPIGINYDMEPAICFDMEGDHWEDETHAWMFIASRTFDKLRAQEARVAELEAEVERLKAEIKTAHADGADAIIASFAHTDLRKRICQLERRINQSCGCGWIGDKEYAECADHAALREQAEKASDQ